MAKQNNKTPSGYKPSPLGLIPNDWQVKDLGSVLTNTFSGGTPSRNIKEYYENGTIPWIKSGEINQIFVNQTEEHITVEGLKNSSAKITPKGTLLYALYGATAGVVGFTNIDAALNQAILAIFPNEKELLKQYLYYFLFYKKENILKEFTQGGQPNLSAGLVKELKIKLPTIKEQTAIANLLSIWDDAIQNTTQLIAQKEQRKKWLMQQLLTGKKRLKGFEKEKWKICTLGDLFERVTKKNTERNQTVVTISAQRGFVMQNDYFNKIIASDILDNYFLVEKGEFCYNKSYSNGYPWGATKRLNDFEKAVVTTLYICFKIRDPKKTSGDYFEHFFEVNSLDKGLMSVANEGGRAHGLLNVTATDFFNIEIKVPKVEEQEAIAKILSLSVNEIQLLQNKLNYLKEQKKGLMQVLLTGKKRLKIK